MFDRHHAEEPESHAMSSAQVDERPPTKRRRVRPPSSALVDTAAKLVFFISLCYFTVALYYAYRSTHVPTSLVYPRFAEAFVERAAAIGAVVSTSEYNYTGSKILGNGSFGYVFTAVHRTSPHESVAIKSLRNDTKHSSNRTYDAGAAQVLGEARLLTAAAGHPSVVALRAIAVHPTTGDLYLVMEHAGHSLAQELYLNRSWKPFPEEEVRRVMRRLLAGVEHLHSRGVVHRDVKPANILVSGSDVKICDLGVAMPPDEPEPHGRFGTREYIAPEILAGKTDYGAKVDTWSLGCVMAELLGGKQMFYYAGKDDDAAQLRMIFDVLGPPCPGSEPRDDDKAPPPNTSGHRNRLRDLFPEHVLSEEGFDVLKGLLSCDVDRRLSATDALQLPWFADDAGEEPPSATDALQLPWFTADAGEEATSATSTCD